MRYNGWSIGFWVFNLYLTITQLSQGGWGRAAALFIMLTVVYTMGQFANERNYDMDLEDAYNETDYPSA